jgi:D-aminopeptidase
MAPPSRASFITAFAIVALATHAGAFADGRPHARELGIAPGVMEPGPLDAITDVADVRVGQVTLVSGDNVRTGVTVILPHGGNLFQEKVPGAISIGLAFGKLAGSTQVQELGTIETPIVLTNTLAVGTAAGSRRLDAGQRTGALRQCGRRDNDGELNVLPGHVTRAD